MPPSKNGPRKPAPINLSPLFGFIGLIGLLKLFGYINTQPFIFIILERLKCVKSLCIFVGDNYSIDAYYRK